MKAIILGAGRGIPVQSGQVKPKCLVEGISGWRVLDWLLNALTEGGGVDDVVFVGGDSMESVQRHYPRLRFVHNPRWADEHVVGSLFAAAHELDGPFFFSYSDIVYRPAVVESLAASEADVTLVVDRQWKSRYQGRGPRSWEDAEKVATSDDLVRHVGKDLPDGVEADGEFIGLARFSARGAASLREVYRDLSREYADRPYRGRRNLHDGHLTDLLQEMIDRGGRLEVVWVDGDYAELDTPQDLSQFVFGTKAETLERLRPHLTQARIHDGVCVRVADWLRDREAVTESLARHFAGESLAVRSSARGEDSAEASQAGRYASVLGVESAQPGAIATAVQEVVDSYGPTDGEEDHQVLVQSCLDEVAMSGVLMTRDLDTGADYVVVHYDDRTGRTDSVTSGTIANTRVVRIRRDRERLPVEPTLNALLRTAQELESITGSDALDVEFAFTRDGQLHVLQVRPIATAHRWRPLDRRAHARELRGIRAFLEQRMRSWPGVRGRTTILGQMPDWNPAEMIGPFPKPLARSLYELLITDHTWRLGRVAIGYADPFPHPLMVEIAGRPYVDLRLSANNLLPARMDADLRERIVDAGLGRLERHPELHDKVEFEVFPTAWDFDIDRTLENLVEHGLPREDLPACREALLDHTRELLGRGREIVDGQLARTETLQQRAAALFDEEPGDDLLARIAEVLALTVRDGTFPFAVLARLAFVGTSLLRSLGACGALEPGEITRFVGDVRTVSTEMVDMLERVRSGEVSRDDFLARFGHLRPGSYDLLSCRYDQDPGLYFPAVEAEKCREAKATSETATGAIGSRSRARIDALLTEHGLGIDAEHLLNFVAEAIRARELAKFRFTFSLSGVLEWLAEFGDRYGLDREDVAHLDIHRLLDLTRGPLPSDLDERLSQEARRSKERRNLESAILLPGLIFGPQDVDIVREPATRPNFVTTRSVTAPVVRLGSGGKDGTDANGAGADLEGRIVVIESADPGYDWIFTRSLAGLVTLYGGANSHMTIRCAEFGLPAAIGCGREVFEKLKDCESVTLDCGEQRIHGLG